MSVCITKGVRKLRKPQCVHVFLDHNTHKTSLSVVHHDGTTAMLPISRKVAEVLIARGMGYGG